MAERRFCKPLIAVRFCGWAQILGPNPTVGSITFRILKALRDQTEYLQKDG